MGKPDGIRITVEGCSTEDDFAESYAKFFRKGGLVVPANTERSIGSELLIEYVLGNGLSVFRAQGEVRKVKYRADGSVLALILKLQRMNAASKGIYKKAMALRQERKATTGEFQATTSDFETAHARLGGRRPTTRMQALSPAGRPTTNSGPYRLVRKAPAGPEAAASEAASVSREADADESPAQAGADHTAVDLVETAGLGDADAPETIESFDKELRQESTPPESRGELFNEISADGLNQDIDSSFDQIFSGTEDLNPADIERIEKHREQMISDDPLVIYDDIDDGEDVVELGSDLVVQPDAEPATGLDEAEAINRLIRTVTGSHATVGSQEEIAESLSMTANSGGKVDEEDILAAVLGDDDTPRARTPLPPPKKKGFFARLFGRDD